MKYNNYSVSIKRYGGLCGITLIFIFPFVERILLRSSVPRYVSEISKRSPGISSAEDRCICIPSFYSVLKMLPHGSSGSVNAAPGFKYTSLIPCVETDNYVTLLRRTKLRF